MPHNAENDTFTRLAEWIPAESLRDARFAAVIRRMIAEEQPATAVEEFALAQVIEGMWRLSQSMRLSNTEHAAADSKSRAQVERSLARAEVAWMRLKRFAASEARAQIRAERTSKPAHQTPQPAEIAAPEHTQGAERRSARSQDRNDHVIAAIDSRPSAKSNTNGAHRPQSLPPQQPTATNPSPSPRISPDTKKPAAAHSPNTLEWLDIASVDAPQPAFGPG